MKKFQKTTKSKIILGFTLCVLLFGMMFGRADAYKVEDLFGKVDQGDIAMSGGKSELVMKPGESQTITIGFSNRLGKTETFKIVTEDLGIGSDEEALPGSATGEDISPYSLKDYIYPEVSEFTLEDMKKVRMPVTITIPTDTRVGTLVGQIVFSLKDPLVTDDSNGGKLAIENRLAYKVYIRIVGNEEESGFLESFYTDKNFYEYAPIPLKFRYENDGNIYLVPHGTITIKNMLGLTVEQIEVKNYYVQPETIKTKVENFNRKFLIGKYSARLDLDRGYFDQEELTDSQTISFWVIPWKILLIVFAVLVLLIWLGSIIANSYKISKR